MVAHCVLLVQAPALPSDWTSMPRAGPAPGPHHRVPFAQPADGEMQTKPMAGMLTGLRIWMSQVPTGPAAPMSSAPLRPKVSGTGRAAMWMKIRLPHSGLEAGTQLVVLSTHLCSDDAARAVGEAVVEEVAVDAHAVRFVEGLAHLALDQALDAGAEQRGGRRAGAVAGEDGVYGGPTGGSQLALTSSVSFCALPALLAARIGNGERLRVGHAHRREVGRGR